MNHREENNGIGSLLDKEIVQHVLGQDNDTLKTIMNSLADGVIIADKDGNFLFFNPVAEKILGIGSRHILSSEWSSVYGCFYPDTVTPYPSEQLPLARTIREGKACNDLIFIRNSERPEGIYVDAFASPIIDKNGAIAGGSVIFRDITAQKRAEIRLIKSEKRNRDQFNGFPIPAYVWQYKDDDFILIDYNDAAETFTQNNIKRYLQIRLNQMYPNSPDIQADFFRCLYEKITFKREMNYKFKSTGEMKDLVVTYVFVPPDLIMVHTEDITEKKKTGEGLKKLSNAVEQTADSVVITNEKSIIEYVNPAFEQTTGYSFEEVRGKTPKILFSGKHDKLFYKNLWETILSGNPFKGTIINKKKNGELYWCEQTITPMKDENGKITNFVSVMKDITEIMKKREQEFLLGLVQELQKRLYRTSISVPGIDIAGTTFPVDQTNGDYFDIFPMKDGKVGLVVGDVCGHGICAALIMAETRAYLRAFAKIESDPGIIFNMLNQELTTDLDEQHYVTMIFTVLNPREKSLVYVSAGHVPGFLLDNSGTVNYKMESTGIPLGFIHDYNYETSETIKLPQESTLVLLTDGITEALSPDDVEFGEQRALDQIRANKKVPAKQILKQLYEAVLSFSNNNQADDITGIVCKINRT